MMTVADIQTPSRRRDSDRSSAGPEVKVEIDGWRGVLIHRTGYEMPPERHRLWPRVTVDAGR